MNRLLLIATTVLVIVLTGCSNKDKAPADILPKEKMEAVLWDILQAERFTATFVIKDSTKNLKAENFKYYSQIFAIHDVTKEKFIESYKFYLSRPDIARVLFDSLATKANRQREEMYKQTPLSGNDSLKTQPAKPGDTTVSVSKAVDSAQKRMRDSLLKRTLPSNNNEKIKQFSPDSLKRRPLRPVRPGMLRFRDTIKKAS